MAVPLRHIRNTSPYFHLQAWALQHRHEYPEDFNLYIATLQNARLFDQTGEALDQAAGVGDPEWMEGKCDEHEYSICPADCTKCKGDPSICCRKCHRQNASKWDRGTGDRWMTNQARIKYIQDQDRRRADRVAKKRKIDDDKADAANP